MNLQEYKGCIGKLPFGKRLPGAHYVVRDTTSDFGPELNQLLAQLAVVFEVGPQFNVIKFRTDELKLSFLCYPDFMDDPHPALRHAITIDLANGKARHTDYADNLNRPILHRKETFLATEHPQRAAFAALTKAEETAGLAHNWYERQIEITEQSWALEGYNSVLTMLAVADVDGADDHDMVRHYEIKSKRE